MEAAKLYLVKQVINYLYTGECQWKEFEKEQIVAQTEGVLLSCIKLAEYAHYLGLSDMEEYIGEHLRNHLSYTADEVQKSDVFGNGRAVPLSDKFLRNYITAAEEAFSSLDTVPLPNCREAFIKFVADTRYLVMLDGGFSETIKEVPELHEAIVQSMFDEGSPFLDMVSFNRPSECDVCEETLTVYATSSLVLPKVRGTCFRCAEKP
ncbi:hypothetical protein ED733_001517 [Metarhizium rileyi]|uniref:BTB/POZ fold protein n=1 Tax=Metarhizium rileyi (strain RCEF 4871) TaxID=1649241 RepID=A0A5C6GBH8_METRR|nr:hypothetical protein ED733_001517 [Metarhizium rileyi]